MRRAFKRHREDVGVRQRPFPDRDKAKRETLVFQMANGALLPRQKSHKDIK